MVKPNKLKVKKIMKTKLINEGLKSDTRIRLKIIETLSAGNPIDLPWQTTLSILLTCKVNNKNPNDISLHNPYEILYVDDASEQEVKCNY